MDDLLASVCQKAWGKTMNSMWSAWANEILTVEEIQALEDVGVHVNPGCSIVNFAEIEI